MNFKLLVITLFISLFISAFSCSNNPTKSRKPVVNIKIETPNKKIKVGDYISINVSVKIKDGSLDFTKVYIDTVLIIEENSADFIHKINNFDRVGQHNIKVVSVKTDGTEGVYYKSLEVLSDLEPEKYGFEIVKSFPHNETFFTQGLEFSNGFLYEGTGENGKSAIYKCDYKTGKVLNSVKLHERHFGEGITILNNKIYQLTYKTKTGFVYEAENMALIDSFSYSSPEGWGLTNNKKELIMSDGTNILTYLDPITYKKTKILQVYDNKNAMLYLNELEYFEGYIYANIWTTNIIAKIDEKTGKVVAKINMDGLLTLINPEKQVDVLNGIAIETNTGKIFVTGKLYPKIFEIKLIKKE